MKTPNEWAQAAGQLARDIQSIESDAPELVREAEREFLRISRDFSGWAVRFGTYVELLADAGHIPQAKAIEILDRLYEQRSYAAA